MKLSRALTEEAIGMHPVDDTSDAESPYPYDMIRPIPRRRQISHAGFKQSKIHLPARTELKTSNRQVAWRLVIWTSGIVSYFSGNLIDRMLRRRTEHTAALRLRHTLENMGPTAIKVGQQLSVRADMLPYQYCEELSKMLDRVPPFPFEQAVAIIERSTRRPLNESFAVLDPHPIGSASMACVYQAQLHTGEMVAVKVKRPNIGSRMATDLRALSSIFVAAEWLGLIRPGLTRTFRQELARMLSEELNFQLESRYTEIFRRNCKHERDISSPKVYHEFCNDDVIVTEFISGVFMIEMLQALDQGDEAAIARFRAQGFNFRKLARRMNRVFHWEFFETIFFHADPHPANIIVRPDNTLVMIDFGSCGTVSNAMKRNLMQFYEQWLREDLYNMADTIMAMLEPLPPIDTDGFRNDLVNILRECLIAFKSKHSHWSERCSGGMWMKIIAICRQYNIPMALDTVRVFRATFMYDCIVYRLFDRVDPRAEYEKWSRIYRNRIRKAYLKGAVTRAAGGPQLTDFARDHELRQLVDQTQGRIQKWLDTPKYNFSYGVSKVAYAFSTAMKTIVRALQFFLVCFFLRELYLLFQFLAVPVIPAAKGAIVDSPGDFLGAMIWVARNPFFLGALFVYIFIAVRKIIVRFDDIDID